MTTQPVRLRRLEIQGFKSFASRATFEFGPGVTAIVGPNGSGKSNLADAFRWVLGEQNPRNMRLRRLEDAIFAGGGKRAQSGFAEVSLVLDNSEGWLPIDFGEVVVTRRLHRSGESEYLLNRNRTRLRDILDLFLRGRLGQNSYAILGQGMVDLVLSLRPEERRALIEEAADVRRHRLKIEEAVDQLSATRDNRDRIELLIAEIGPRLEQLERQARRAEQHAGLSAELAENLRALFGYRRRASSEALESARQEEVRAAQESKQAVDELRSLEARVVEQQEVLFQAEAELGEYQGVHRTLEDELLSRERALTAASERVPAISARIDEVQADLDALLEEEIALEAEVNSTVSPVESLEKAQIEAQAAQHSFESSNAALETAKRRVDAAGKALTSERERHVTAQDRLLRLEVERGRLVLETERLVDRRTAALERLRTWASNYADAWSHIQEHARQVQATEALQADAVQRAALAQSSVFEAESGVTDLTERLEASRRRAQQLASEQESRRPTEDVIVALLDALRGGGPGRPRVLGILGGLIHVQRGYEIAIEAGLAEAMNALVVRTEREALGAVAVLQEIEAGRLSFFVLEGLRGSHALNLSGEAGVLGVASRFVRCEETYRDLVDLLLGRIIVVEDLEVARRVARRGLGAAVTLDGTVIRSGGMVSGGRGKSDGFVFQTGLDLDEAEAEIATLEPQLESERDRLRRLQLQGDETASRVTSVTTALNRLRHDLDDYNAAIARSRADLGQIRGELEWIRVELAAARTRALTVEEEVLAVPVETDGNDDKIAKLTERLREFGDELERAKAAQESAERALFESKGRYGALVAERAAIETLRRSHREARDRARQRIAARRQSLESLRDEHGRAESNAERLAGEAGVLRGSAVEAGLRLESAKARVLEIRQQLQGSEEQQSRARERQAGLEHRRLNAELERERAEEEVRRLQSDMEREGLEELGDAGRTEHSDAPLDDQSLTEIEASIRSLRRRIHDLGSVSDEAMDDYRDSKERFDFLSAQVADLRDAEASLLEALDQLRQLVRDQFRATFQTVNTDFQSYFRTFFGGGQARLALAEPEDYGESGVDIIAQPPGKRLQNLAMLSGGERSMTAVALLFALLESNPAPFCILDEVDAALDEANVGRFSEALSRLAGRSQFLVITHNRGTVQAADQIYGVSMAADGVSNVLSMRLSDATPLLA
jgi:chromosome segregation protein